MKKSQLICLIALLAFVASFSSPARAQLWASPAGSGTACLASSPCLLTTAMTQSASSGIMATCIDGGFAFLSAPNTANSFTVDCPGGLVSPNGEPVLTLTGTSAQVVKLRNLIFTSIPDLPSSPFIRVTGGATLIIENCKFEDDRFSSAGGTSPIAIQFQPTGPAAQLIIRDTVFSNNGFPSGAGGAVQVVPGSGGSASVMLERVSFNYNVTSMVLAGSVDAVMSNSTVSSSRSNGILVSSGATLNIKDSMLVHNVGSAVSISSGGTLRLSNNDIEGNQVGVSNSGGHAFTYSNNRIIANGTDGTLTPIPGYTGGGK